MRNSNQGWKKQFKNIMKQICRWTNPTWMLSLRLKMTKNHQNMLAKHSHREPSIQESKNHSDSINFNRNHWDPSRDGPRWAHLAFAWCARICTWCPPEQSGWHVIGHVDRVHKLLGIVSKLIWFMSCYMGLFSGNHAVAGMWPYVWEFLWYLHHCNLQVVPRCWCTKWLFPVVPRWWKGRIENMDMLEGNIPRQFWSTEGRKWQTIRPQLHTSPQKAQHASFPLRFIKLWQGALVTELYFCLPSLPLDLFGITALGTVQQPLLEENVQALAWAHPWALERLWTYGLR